MLPLKLDELYISGNYSKSPQVVFSPSLLLKPGPDCSIQHHYKFFLSEAFLGHHLKHVELEGEEPKPGDLFLLRLMSHIRCWCRAHVDVHYSHR